MTHKTYIPSTVPIEVSSTLNKVADILDEQDRLRAIFETDHTKYHSLLYAMGDCDDEILQLMRPLMEITMASNDSSQVSRLLRYLPDKLYDSNAGHHQYGKDLVKWLERYNTIRPHLRLHHTNYYNNPRWWVSFNGNRYTKVYNNSDGAVKEMKGKFKV